MELTPNLSGLAERKAGLAEGQRVSVYIKAILPERMKIKLLAIDTLPPLDAPAPLEYFITQGRLEKWEVRPAGLRQGGGRRPFSPEKGPGVRFSGLAVLFRSRYNRGSTAHTPD